MWPANDRTTPQTPPAPAVGPRASIRLRGVRQNNLKGFDLDLPLRQLIVITGLSGSGKSSLAFDTLFAEGQRRYIETFSPYARQFFDRMDKPRVDSIEGIPPAIAVEQRNAVRSVRSTVGTMTEVCDFMKNLWPHLAQLYCDGCGQPVRKESPTQIWDALPHTKEAGAALECLVTFDIALSEKMGFDEALDLIRRQGYQRALWEGVVCDLEALPAQAKASPPKQLTLVQDRLKLSTPNRARFVEACEQAFHFGKGLLAVHLLPKPSDATATEASPRRFSNRLHCAACDKSFNEPSPALFSYNHPVGACPKCHGFGRVIAIDDHLVMPDLSKTLAQGVVKPWRTGKSAECQDDLMKFCRIRRVPIDVPFQDLPEKWRQWVIEGDPGYGQDKAHEWPHAWYGVRGYFRWLESKTYKMHVRVLLSRYRSYSPCPDCGGQRLQPEALRYRVAAAQTGSVELSLANFYGLTIAEALQVADRLAATPGVSRNSALKLAFGEVRSRLGYLVEAGLGYLTLDRPSRTLSGGETERVNLAACLGTRLVNTLFILDEPSVGLHPRDTDNLVRILQRLRGIGNTVVVVEHEASVMRAADQIVDLGPASGRAGGEVIFQGSFKEILKSPVSLTGQYLKGTRQNDIPHKRPVSLPAFPAGPTPPAAPATAHGVLKVAHATRHNLRDVTVEIPLQRLVCITGVSGSGKTTLTREILFPALNARLNASVSLTTEPEPEPEAEAEADEAGGYRVTVSGWESLGQVLLVDQAILSKTPRSNPVVYIGAFDALRELFARSEAARQRGLGASAFSFNSAQGQCERCRGAGFEKIEMQFLSDVFIKCPDCEGKRYRAHILEVLLETPRPMDPNVPDPPGTAWNIADLLNATVDEAVVFLAAFPDSRHAQQAIRQLRWLQDVGLGYLQLGQPLNTLSGGENQRLKLVRHLADFSTGSDRKRALFLFDEPTTGLHFHDVGVLLKVFQHLVDDGHSVLVIEHNLDVVKAADWVIDLGPEGGPQGGKVVATGPPRHIASVAESHTGRALADALTLCRSAAPIL